MKIIALLSLILFYGIAVQAEESWINSLETSLEEAARTDKAVYISFVGLNWSVSSKKWNREMHQSEAFRAFASENLIELTINARTKPQLSKRLQSELQALVVKFDIKSYPTLIVLNSDGVELHRHGYLELSPEAYISALSTLIE